MSATEICNMSLGRIGAKRINDIEDATDTKPEAIQCRLHYEQTRDALLRSNWWAFASDRESLTAESTAPDFEWDSQFPLPSDFLAMKAIYEDNNTARRISLQSYAIEGNKILSNESSMRIRYVKRVTDTSQFDPLFTEVLVLMLAIKLVMPLSQDKVLYRDLKEELKPLMLKVRTHSRQESETIGRTDLRPWNDARATNGGRIDSQLGS